MSRLSALVLTLLQVFGVASAAPSTASASNAVVSPVHFHSPSANPSPIHPGEVVRLSVSAGIDQGWHVYSVTPSAGQGPFTTTLSVTGENADVAGAPSESATIDRYDSNFQTKVAYHVQASTFTLPVRIATSAQPGIFNLMLSIRYQACNDRLCDPPLTQTFTIPVTVASGAVRASYAELPQSAARPSGGAPTAPPSGLLGFIAFAFVAGLLTLLTPCVFPLIPVTFGYFTKEAAGQRKTLVVLAGVYVAGIIVSFVVLGLIATVTQNAAGPNRIAANPYINVAFGLLFVVLAFAFFETFNLRLPFWLQSLATGSRAKGGVVGVLLMGLAFVFTAFTCTAPFIASVLATAASTTGAAEYARPLLGMVVFATALSLPFFAIALFPPLLTRLPRSGAWLSRMKALLGFVELAYAVLYFSKADLVWQAHVLTRPLIFGLWAMISVGAALYLLGALRVNSYSDEPGKMNVGRGIGIALFVSIALYCSYAMTGRPLDKNLAAFVPEADYGFARVKATPGQLDWLGDYDTALQLARSRNKPLFIDFTGYTCTNCRWMEQNIFTDRQVQDRLSKYVLVKLYTDGGSNADRNQALQLRIGKAIAQPLYVIMDSAGKSMGVKVGVENDSGKFAAYLDKGLAPPSEAASAAAWAPFNEAAYASALAAGKPIVIDFTASWCVSCHAIERQVFEDPQVNAKLAGFTTLRADLTDFDGAPNAAIEKKFGVQQLPTVVLLSPSGIEVPGTRVTGLLPTKDFLARLVRASSGG